MKTDHKNIALLKKNRGFTLIEVLIALAIFSIGILAVGRMQLGNTKNNTTGNITTQATMLARQKIEELKSQDIADLTPGTRIADPNNPIDDNGGPGGAYWRYWTIVDKDTFRQLTVEVEWNKRGAGQNRRVELETITRGFGQ